MGRWRFWSRVVVLSLSVGATLLAHLRPVTLDQLCDTIFRELGIPTSFDSLPNQSLNSTPHVHKTSAGWSEDAAKKDLSKGEERGVDGEDNEDDEDDLDSIRLSGLKSPTKSDSPTRADSDTRQDDPLSGWKNGVTPTNEEWKTERVVGAKVAASLTEFKVRFTDLSKDAAQSSVQLYQRLMEEGAYRKILRSEIFEKSLHIKYKTHFASVLTSFLHFLLAATIFYIRLAALLLAVTRLGVKLGFFIYPFLHQLAIDAAGLPLRVKLLLALWFAVNTLVIVAYKKNLFQRLTSFQQKLFSAVPYVAAISLFYLPIKLSLSRQSFRTFFQLTFYTAGILLSAANLAQKKSRRKVQVASHAFMTPATPALTPEVTPAGSPRTFFGLREAIGSFTSASVSAASVPSGSTASAIRVRHTRDVNVDLVYRPLAFWYTLIVLQAALLPAQLLLQTPTFNIWRLLFSGLANGPGLVKPLAVGSASYNFAGRGASIFSRSQFARFHPSDGMLGGWDGVKMFLQSLGLGFGRENFRALMSLSTLWSLTLIVEEIACVTLLLALLLSDSKTLNWTHSKLSRSVVERVLSGVFGLRFDLVSSGIDANENYGMRDDESSGLSLRKRTLWTSLASLWTLATPHGWSGVSWQTLTALATHALPLTLILSPTIIVKVVVVGLGLLVPLFSCAQGRAHSRSPGKSIYWVIYFAGLFLSVALLECFAPWVLKSVRLRLVLISVLQFLATEPAQVTDWVATKARTSVGVLPQVLTSARRRISTAVSPTAASVSASRPTSQRGATHAQPQGAPHSHSRHGESTRVRKRSIAAHATHAVHTAHAPHIDGIDVSAASRNTAVVNDQRRGSGSVSGTSQEGPLFASSLTNVARTSEKTQRSARPASFAETPRTESSTDKLATEKYATEHRAQKESSHHAASLTNRKRRGSDALAGMDPPLVESGARVHPKGLFQQNDAEKRKMVAASDSKHGGTKGSRRPLTTEEDRGLQHAVKTRQELTRGQPELDSFDEFEFDRVAPKFE